MTAATIQPTAGALDFGKLSPTAVRILKFAPWAVFGPITGVLSGFAFSAIQRGKTGLAVFYLALNVAILIAMPTATAALAARL
jgi:hypothetical protein